MKVKLFYITTILTVIIVLNSCTVIPDEPEIDNNQNNIDTIYSWIKYMQLDNGLVPSYEYEALGMTESGYEVSLYDNALAVIVFCLMSDFDRAEKILSFFDSRLDSEFTQATGGFSQFRYSSSGDALNSARWMGDNAWLLVAINNYHYLKGSTQYSQMAEKLASYLTGLQDGDGGVFSGHNEDGSIIKNKVVEGNIDAFNAVPGFTDFHRNLINYLADTRWDNNENLFIAWPGSAWEFALDTSPWGYCAIPDLPIEILSNTDRFKVTKVPTYISTEITGFCFDEDLDTLWLEGTGEMVVAYNKAGMYTEAEYYLKEMEKIFIQSPGDQNYFGLPYVIDNSGTHYGDGTLIDATDNSPWLSSSIWYIFGKVGFDPFAVGRNKIIPDEDHPWK